MRLPNQFLQTVKTVYKEAGEQWLANLDQTIREIEARHHVQVKEPLTNLSYNLVCNALDQNGNEAIFRFGPRNKETDLEIAALQTLQGQGMVNLLQVFPEGGVLIEKLTPGTTLENITTQEEDDRATAALAISINKVLSQRHNAQGTTHTFPTLQDWAGGLTKLRTMFDGGAGPLDAKDVERAERIFHEFIQTPASSPQLLHGDLHHGNVLFDQHRGWVAIDPKGVIAELAYEAAPIFYNPRAFIDSSPDLKPIFDRRLHILSEHLGIDRQRIKGYAFAQAILSACWTIEDHEDLNPRALRVAEALR